jgi:diguanylate cyclase (GGDEF)-like protein/PAS domain S-box-containing protein
MTPHPKQQNIKLPARTAVFLGVVCCAILAWSGWREWQSRKADLALAEIETRNLSRSVTQYADDTLELSNSLLNALVSRLESDGTGPDAIAKLRKVLESRKPALGRVRGLFVYDERGGWLATTENIDFAGLNNSDRDYFVRHKGTDSPGLLIGKPVKSRSGGQWIITVSRRFNHPDGSFAGVALATVEVVHFANFFSQFDLGPKGSISLLTRDGIILSRYPENGTYVGMDLSQTPLFTSLAQRPPEGAYNFKSPLDGEDRLSSYRVSSLYPLVAIATKTEDDVLAQWKREALGRLIFVLALCGLIAGFGWYLVRQLLEGQRLSHALASQEADFRLLAEESSDMVLRIGLDARIQYVSPSCSRILGCEPAALINTDSLAGVHPEDRPRVADTIAKLKSAEINETKIAYRTRRVDNSPIWLETALRSTRGGTGELNGVVAISRDVTAHVALNARLTALAKTDALTGLANRRQFEEMFEAEWARAARDGSQLAVILLDVDHFKKYNDHYGHPAGDVALQEIAKVLGQHARRPGDMAARYGGEEFVLLLPNTQSAGAANLADAIRRAVSDQNLPHALNGPSRRITVSLGVASVSPRDSRYSRKDLLKWADEALYDAKATGRDRVALYGASEMADVESATLAPDHLV